MSIGTAGAARTRRLRRLAACPAAALLAAAFVLGTGGPAAAHARLVGSSPSADGSVDTALRSVALTFDEGMRRSFALVTVTGPDGRRLDTGAPQVAGGTVTQRVAPLPGPGRYTVSFRVVSGDGHPVSGKLRFRFAPPAGYRPPTPAAAAAVNAPATPGAAVARTGGGPAADAGWLGRHGTTLVLVVVVAVAGGATVALDRSRRQHP